MAKTQCELRYEASNIVANIADAGARKAAESGVMQYLRNVDDGRYWNHPSNLAALIIGIILAALGWLSLTREWSYAASFAVACGIDLCIGLLLLIVALHADDQFNLYFYMPHRLHALILCALFFVGLVCAFGNMYREVGGICPKDEVCVGKAEPNQAAVSQATVPKMLPESVRFETNTDAVYFSVVTMTTLGYGDFSAGSQEARKLVLWQLASSISLIVLLVPLVMSRLAAY